MPTKRFDFAYTETPLVELPTPLQKLAEEALKSTMLSYAPFSGFHVGCAVLLDNGEVVVGANQENASYPCGLCAERVALYNASTLHPKAKIVALAIAAKSGDSPTEDPISPCGACRQVILEMEDRYKRPVRILLFGARAVYAVNSVKDLLPLSFVDANMR